jgi:hypothetical protein
MTTIEEKIKEGVGLAPYNFELFRRLNPCLTKEVYDYLRGNKSEWRIICGHKVSLKYSKNLLEGRTDLTLANINIYNNRYSPEYYLNPENWNHGRTSR